MDSFATKKQKILFEIRSRYALAKIPGVAKPKRLLFIFVFIVILHTWSAILITILNLGKVQMTKTYTNRGKKRRTLPPYLFYHERVAAQPIATP